MASKGVWDGVDRTYAKLLDEHPTLLDGTLHMLAANASLRSGDVVGGLQRMSRVIPGDAAYEDAQTTTAHLRSSTQLVALTASEGAKLRPVVMPLDPNLRNALEHAQRELEQNGLFVGSLPTGSYRLDDLEVRIVTGPDWQVLP
jgi:hypothetical protein